MKLRMLVALLAATGCAQPTKITANDCEVVAYRGIGGGDGYTSGINHPKGQYRNYAELALVEDTWLSVIGTKPPPTSNSAGSKSCSPSLALRRPA